MCVAPIFEREQHHFRSLRSLKLFNHLGSGVKSGEQRGYLPAQYELRCPASNPTARLSAGHEKYCFINPIAGYGVAHFPLPVSVCATLIGGEPETRCRASVRPFTDSAPGNVTEILRDSAGVCASLNMGRMG